jgi:hypothetical protein
MILEKAKKPIINDIKIVLTPQLIKDPQFMCFCPDQKQRKNFINSFFDYYIYEWSRYDTLLCDEMSKCLVSLVDPDTFSYKFKGKGAYAMKHKKTSSAIFVHRENLESIIDIVVPYDRQSRILNIYANPDNETSSISSLIDEAMLLSKRDGYVLVYETFSKKLIELMEEKGFTLAYQKRFLNTQFIETVMTYNL